MKEETIQKAYQRLHRKETDEIVEYAYDLEQQLKAYKDKEDKIRGYVKGLEKDNLKDLSEFEPTYIFESIIFAIKQILNEGDK